MQKELPQSSSFCMRVLWVIPKGLLMFLHPSVQEKSMYFSPVPYFSMT